MTVHTCFFVIPRENAYNTILGRSFLTALDAVASPVHFKLKYHDKFDRSVVIKKKYLRPTLDVNFETNQLVNNPLRIVKVGVNLPAVIREGLMNCLRSKVDLFDVSPHEMPQIDSNLACNQLNMDPDN